MKNVQEKVGKGKVVRLERRNLYNDIMTYLENKELKSVNTRRAYEVAIKQFFEYLAGKELNELTEDDLVYRNTDIIQYRMFLSESYENTTINQRIATMASLYKFLRANEYDVNPAIFDLDRLVENSKGYGMLHREEVLAMIELVKGHRKGLEKSLLIEMAAKTGFRLAALLGLEWDDIRKEMEGDKVKYYRAETIDKGKPHSKPLCREFYDRLVELKGNGGKVFGLTEKTIGKMMKRLVLDLELDPDGNRNITFHSIKKAGIHEMNAITGGDLMKAAYFGNHGAMTSLKHYQERKDKENDDLVLQMWGDVDLGKLEELSKEGLLGLIKRLDRGTQVKMVGMIGE